MQLKRLAALKGSFYPDNCNKLKIYFQKFTDAIGSEFFSKPISKIVPRAILSPHAGYIYSGFTANVAYKVLSNSKAKRVVVIGPSHHHYFKGISGSYYESYETPCTDLEIDTAFLIELAKKHPIGFEPKAHLKEHSTEVQMPFISHYLPNTKVVELIYGDIDPKIVSNIITTILEDRDNVVVISSDLSHFHTQQKAKELDKKCLQAISLLKIYELNNGCEACGMIGIKAILLTANELKLNSKLLDYRTSMEYSGDDSSVVGYASAVFYWILLNLLFIKLSI